MNYLRGKKVYLSGPMHLAKDNGILWRELITPRLIDMGIEVLDPCKKKKAGDIEIGEVGKEDKERFQDIILQENWSELKKEFWPVVRSDLRMVDHCDFLIFDYEPLIPIVGTIHELVVATFEKKVILLKYDREDLQDFNPWIATFVKEHHLFAEWDDMFEHLRRVNNGEFDTSLWII